MGFADFMLGAKPSFGTLPGYSDLIGGIKDYNPGIGYAGKMAKKQLKSLYSGDDISSMGQFNSIRQKEAADLAGVDMDAGSGANALMANSGMGDQPGLLSRSMEGAKERVRQNAGMQSVDALNNFQQNANQTYGNAYQNMQQNQQNKFGMWGNALQNSLYDNKRQGGGFLGALGGLAQGAGSIIGGLKM